MPSRSTTISVVLYREGTLNRRHVVRILPLLYNRFVLPLNKAFYRRNDTKPTVFWVLGTSTVGFSVNGKMLTMSNKSIMRLHDKYIVLVIKLVIQWT